MILAALAQFAVCFLILAWVLKKKTGEPYSRKVGAWSRNGDKQELLQQQ